MFDFLLLFLFNPASAREIVISHFKLEKDYYPWRIFDSHIMENYLESLEHQIFMQKYVMGYWPVN